MAKSVTGRSAKNANSKARGDVEKRQYTIKGIDSDTLQLMRSAADKEGMKVGAWVSLRIHEAAERALSGNERVEVADIKKAVDIIGKTQTEELAKIEFLKASLMDIVLTQNKMMSKMISDSPATSVKQRA